MWQTDITESYAVRNMTEVQERASTGINVMHKIEYKINLKKMSSYDYMFINFKHESVSKILFKSTWIQWKTPQDSQNVAPVRIPGMVVHLLNPSS